MVSRKIATLFLVLAGLLTPLLRGGVPLDYYLPAGTTYEAKVPTPEQFFGFQVGEWHLNSTQVAAYLHAVAAAAPDRVKLEISGYTYEHKPLVTLTITAPENQQNLEQIRLAHLALLDPAQSARAELEKMPVVIDMGYSIHGDEPSGVNAMVLFVYYLAAAQGETIERQLREAVILIEAQRNPDGGDRAAQWFNQHKSLSAPSADPDDREHRQAWPGGRYNHYWFDPNRDWLPLVHPEARVRAELFQNRRPHVLTDHHEMSSSTTFFFQPGVPTRNNPTTMKRVFELTHKIAAFHQRELDRHGVLYFSEQGYDDFYPGKGSTYPDLQGAVGILFEQASARGHAQENPNGLLTFPAAIRNQVFTSFSSLEASVALRPELLALQRDHALETAKLSAKSPVRAYVFGDDNDPARAQAFLDLLHRHRIDVRPLTKEFAANDTTFKPGAAWVVPVEQSQFRLIHEIFVERTEFEDNTFYDVSAWTLPHAFNLPYAAVDAMPAMGDAPVGAPAFPLGKVVAPEADYAFVFNWNDYYAPRALLRLQKAGVLVKGLTGESVQAVVADGTTVTLNPGAVLIPLGLQPEKAGQIRELIATIAREDAVTVYGCSTGLTPAGVDFGSASFVRLDLPKVALIVGQGADPQEIGAAWHVLDQRLGLTPTLLDSAQLGRAELARYSFIMFADGSYAGVVDDKTAAALKDWVKAGGTLFLANRSIEWAAKKEIAHFEFEIEKPDPKAAPPERQPYAIGRDREALNLVSGAIVAASIDVTHPLGYGFNSDRLYFCRANMIRLKPAKSVYETPAVYTDSPLRSGYISKENQARIANTAAALALTSGRGVVVALPDDPNFRGFWFGGNRVFFNAIFYGQAIQSIRTFDDDEAHSH